METLTVNNLEMAYPDKKLFSNVNFKLTNEDHVGLIGDNGAGKSTLIKILTKQLDPLGGDIHWRKNIKIGYLDQYVKENADLTVHETLQSAFAELYKLNDELNKDYMAYAENADDDLLTKAGELQEILDNHEFYEIETKIDKVVAGLGLTSIDQDAKMAELSGGQRAKVMLAKLLLSDNDMMILDEPTNNLDTDQISWLSDYLNDFDGTILVISHDFDFLSKITNAILDISYGTVTKYSGNYNKAMQQKQENAEQQEREYVKQQAVIKKEQDYIAKNKARSSTAKQAKSREKKLEKLEKVSLLENDQSDISYQFPFSNKLSTVEAKDLVVGYDGVPLLDPLTIKLTGHDKLIISGFNGVGKSTTIKTILGLLQPVSGNSELGANAKVNYFKQDLIWPDDSKTPLQEMQNAFQDLDTKKLRQVLATSGINAGNATKPLRDLSGGEQTRVKLAKMTLIPSNILILDEPSNHLDERSKTAVKKALIDYPGIIILVSHEPDFVADLPFDQLEIGAN
ncbi:ATPase subunit of ABC transporter with duplicated ATPase domains [Weissella uvarum]|uniref:ABC-F family ATP-binding cassette domain-containing protein n=1 Tax=Weissella uvarum TaxID=1479233 RepID=UPI00195FE815|nr:ABC-F family ATP-binding cassette domain-containing protein [Weissella uvarum]MBM7617628.1 ATPase subunit of ABC transporter with duplicated ATPase domains [Weissella uvarum]MCM0595978.1 ABC-F family ATP-binding cassette domain-containing protein [Weissella uvarum]